MGKITLVTGGARSGKSNFAEELVKESQDVCYVATNVMQISDIEMEQRVRLHQQQRPKKWVTEERFLQVDLFLREKPFFSAYLLDCVTLLTTNYLYNQFEKQWGHDYQKIDQQIEKMTELQKRNTEMEIIAEWTRIVSACKAGSGHVVLVTNEVGLGIVPETKISRWFRDLLGRVNQYLGKEADDVYFVVCGIPTKIK